MDKASLDAVGEGRARRGTLPKEKDAPADLPDGATVAPPQRRRTPSMYLGGAPRESESEKRLRESIRGARRRDAHPHGARPGDGQGAAAEAARSIESSGRAGASQRRSASRKLKSAACGTRASSPYTRENLVKREKIREDPRVENILGKWWDVTA